MPSKTFFPHLNESCNDTHEMVDFFCFFVVFCIQASPNPCLFCSSPPHLPPTPLLCCIPGRRLSLPPRQVSLTLSSLCLPVPLSLRPSPNCCPSISAGQLAEGADSLVPFSQGRRLRTKVERVVSLVSSKTKVLGAMQVQKTFFYEPSQISLETLLIVFALLALISIRMN